jgi:hypothetical protein
MTSPKPFKNWRVDRVLEALGDHVIKKSELIEFLKEP